MTSAADGDRSLAMSDDGTRVAYDTGAATTPSHVVVYDRSTDVAELDVVGAGPGLSGDGCTVAYSVTSSGTGGDTTTLFGQRLCVSAAVEVVAKVPGAFVNAPAVSADGTVIVWSTGAAVVRYVDNGSGFAPDPTFAPAIPAGSVAGPDVDVSSDGSSVVYEVVPAGGTAADTAVWIWTDDGTATGLVAEGSRRPSISGDGRLVAFESVDVTLSPPSAPAPAVPFVAVYDRDRSAAVIIAQGAWRPAISTDGHHVVSRRAQSLDVTWWSSGDPFASVGQRSLGRTLLADDTADADAPLAAISAHGRWVAFDGDDGPAISADPADDAGTHVWVREERPSGGGPRVDLGTVTTGATLDGTVTITNKSAAGAPLVAPLRVSAPFTLVSTTCAASPPATEFVLQPGQSCTARVRATAGAAGTVSADVTYRVAGEPVVDLVAGVRATVTAPTTTPPTSTTTTSVATPATAERELPQGTVPVRPPVTYPRYTGGGYSYYPGYSGYPRYTGGGSSSSTGTSDIFETASGVGGAVFDPPSFEFAPTIVAAGSRTATITLVNPGIDDVVVTTVALDPPDASANFAIAADSCTGTTLAAGSQCTIDVTFAPVATGQQAATVVATFADGSTATAQLTGLAAEPPVLKVVPGVASTGQVVSLIGSGFPAGATVEVVWDRGTTWTTVISDAGDLTETMVVLPHTLRGPSTVTVLGQPDLFADVTADLLVSSTADRPSTAPLGNVSRPVRN